jgi:hypothetical protein
MDRDQTAELFSQGRDAWNAWAEDRRAARKVLEAEGLWIPKRDWFGHNKIKYAEARLWMESAAADFSGVYFLAASEKAWDERKEAEGGKPPAEPNPLQPRPANFEGFVFPGDVRFDGATFLGASAFDGATFCGDAWFKNVSFMGAAFFKSANFKGGAVFDRSRFRGDAWFRSASFTGHAWFDSVRFHRAASFYSVTAEHGFALIGARFKSKVPDFLSAKFAEPVMFDNIRLETGVEPGGLFRSILGGVFLWLSGNLDHALSAKYRALKRLAAQSEDHGNEQNFFGGELRARRYNEDKPWHPGFWVGIVYEALSGFGHSILRPLLWLFALCLLSSWFYLGQYAPAGISPRAHIQAQILSHLPDRVGTLVPALQPEALPRLACKDGSPGDPAAAAVMLAIKKNSVFAAFDSAEKSTQLYACLYGYDDKLKTPTVPDIVVLWGIWQTFGSAAFLFLLLLALRNQFKIK